MGAHFSFFWHDYETFGTDPRRDRPAQFAGVRTDAELNEIDAPLMHFCAPAPDTLPDPESCLLTGITPQQCLEHGLAEHAFADAIEAQLARPGTVGVGYNSIRFDDEVTRFLFWRNLIDPYAREWQNECGRWDLLDVVRCCHALRPEGITWPKHDDGRSSFKLEHLTAANGLAHDAAHDALSDVRATIALARLIRTQQPRLWDFCLRLRSKQAVVEELATAERAGGPFLHVSGMYGAERGCIAVVWPLAPHPSNKNELIVWDLAQDPQALFDLDAATVRQRLYTRADALPEGVTRLPIKTIHLNKSPVVVANLRTLRAEQAERWGIDLGLAERHAAVLRERGGALAGLWPEVFERPASAEPADVDQDLYGGFLSNEDRRALARLRGLAPEALATRHPAFADPRLDELVFRWRARNFPATLSEQEQQRWHEHRVHRLHEGAGGVCTLEAYFARIDALVEALGEGDSPAEARAHALLEALVDYATEIAPERD
ncbi:MAG TPA: exodeoxyribonuclease I [Methylibium sp.]|nr:exodeoxyribonuclease I [Methylibium sp.]